MASLQDPETLARIRQLTGSSSIEPGERIQSLWRGYGEIRRFQLDDRSVIVKQVEPPPGAHPRKLGSYQVELAWYRDWATRCPPGARVPEALGTWSDGRRSLFVLEDLVASGFDRPGLRNQRDQTELILGWLAAFHAHFLGIEPQGLWAVGSYWHLGTRRQEHAQMRDRRLKRLAPKLDARLRGARFQSLVHGDPKPANFCFSRDGLRVAAVDFQYVGGGPGIRDVACFLGHYQGQDEALGFYFDSLRAELAPEVDADALEAEWRGLYETAWQDYERFLAGWR